MMHSYKTVYEGKEAEIVEKKSRFIATVCQVDTEEEAISFIESMRKQYWNATHNCFAYVVGDRSEIQRFSDDGEPGGTAGKPMLDVLIGEEIHNVAVVVTRYFGGVLLGTGGLVRAYQSAAKAALAASMIITKCAARKYRIGCDYTMYGKVQYILAQKRMSILDTEYTEKVMLCVLIPLEEEKNIIANIIDATNGQVEAEPGEACYFADVNGEKKVFPIE